MRKVTLILGVGYILFGLLQLLSIVRVSSLYQEFDGGLPPVSVLYIFCVLGTFLGYGLVQTIAYFLNFKNKKIYTRLFILGLVFILLWISYLLITGYVANRQMEKLLEEAMQLER